MTRIKTRIPRDVDTDIRKRGLKFCNEFNNPDDDSMFDVETVAGFIFMNYTMGAREQYQIDNERHAAELQELKDRGAEAFCFGYCKTVDSDACAYEKSCPKLARFTQKLNEQ